jgi:hypothetical protein
MNVQHYIDNIVEYLKTPAGWIALAVVLFVAFFMLRGNSPR